ncbi:ElaB/YqjD/DUF883 family membrane-anchored ribosome-binding protein [Sphingomonas zeicaulis]|uniref:hypothetical protein n=1 Tax=Sphingomonas zeicaulis TaxID=1632740 RepID=UPI003D1F7F9B
MSRAISELREAEAKSKAARHQLTTTLITLQKRLTPKALMQEATEEIRERATALAHDTVETIKQRPAAAAGFVAGVGLLLFRDKAMRAAGRLFRSETESDDDELNARMVGESIG